MYVLREKEERLRLGFHIIYRISCNSPSPGKQAVSDRLLRLPNMSKAIIALLVLRASIIDATWMRWKVLDFTVGRVMDESDPAVSRIFTRRRRQTAAFAELPSASFISIATCSAVSSQTWTRSFRSFCKTSVCLRHLRESSIAFRTYAITELSKLQVKETGRDVYSVCLSHFAKGTSMEVLSISPDSQIMHLLKVQASKALFLVYFQSDGYLTHSQLFCTVCYPYDSRRPIIARSLLKRRRACLHGHQRNRRCCRKYCKYCRWKWMVPRLWH